MSKRSQSEERELRAYEAPAFAARMVRVRLDRIRALIGEGHTLADAIRHEARAAEVAVSEWQRRSAEALSYAYARELPVCASCGRRVAVSHASYCPFCGARLQEPPPAVALRQVA